MTVIDRVKELPISDVFAAFFPGIELRRDGRNIVALCPYHQEKTPSFKINVEKNRWHCFSSAGCGGGTSIDLLLKAGLASSPIEAGRLIAERFGIKVERGAKGGGGQKGPVKGETPERGLTLSMLSEAKKLPEKFLRDIGLRNFKYMCDPCVLIPYFNELTELFAVRFRLALDGAERFKWRSGDRVSLYGLNRLRSMREKGWGLIGEGESDCWTGWYHNLPVVGIPGKTNWKSEWRRHFENLQVYLWQEPGAEDLTAKISADIPNLLVIPAPDGIKDISEAHIQGIDVARLIEELKRTAIPAERLRREAIDERIRKLREQATKVLQSDDPLELVKEAIRSLGYGGELRPAIITYLAATSRLLKMRSGSMPVHLLLVGIPSSGKSYTLLIVLRLLPRDVIYEIDAGSPRVLLYDDADLEHRILIFAESDSLPAGEDNPAASAVRNLLQEHRLRYKVTVRDPESGRYIVQDVVKPGPTVLITTAVRRLGPQLDSRLFSLDVPDDVKQIREALAIQASIETAGTRDPDASLIAFQGYLQALAPWDVIVPFAPGLSEGISKSVIAPRVLRDYARLLSLIKAVTIIRHTQRQTDRSSRLVAEIDDYRIVYELVKEMYEATVTGAAQGIRDVVQAVEELQVFQGEITMTKVMKHLGISKASTSRRVGVALRNGWIVNVAKTRNSYDLKPGEPLPDRAGLPHPDSLESSTVSPESGSDIPPLALEDQSGWQDVI